MTQTRRLVSHVVSAWPALLLLLSLLVAAATLALQPAMAEAVDQEPLVIHIKASRYTFEPGVVRVQKGQQVTIRLEALDSAHGLILADYGVELHALPGHPAEVTFVADREGRFSFRCAMPCGDLHPFMQGLLLVEPSMGMAAASTLVFPLAAGMVLVGAELAPPWRKSKRNEGELEARRGFDLWSVGLIRSLLTSRWPFFLLSLMALGGLLITILAGLWGSPLGSHNAGIVFVWILWWALMVLALVPIGGRAWCAVCPLPLPGEWLQRRAIVGRGWGRPLTLGLAWPKALSNVWLQNAAFLGLAVFSAAILTRPFLTGGLLAIVMALALGAALVFRGRVFCRYLCPVGGFIGLYSLAAPIGVRCRDRGVCRAHQDKECVTGSAAGYGCPWGIYPGGLERNAHCGLCLECLRTCSKGNMALYVQAPGQGLASASGSYGEALKAVVLLVSAGMYSAVALGPWGWLKSLAWPSVSPEFAFYALGFLWLCTVAAPAALCAVAWLAKRIGGLSANTVDLAVGLAYGLVPLGLAAWVAFTLSFALTNGSYVLVALSDPLGYGWNLLGTRDVHWRPLLPGAWLQALQAAILLAGLGWSIGLVARRVSSSAPSIIRGIAASLPVAAVCVGFGLTFLWLYLGG